MPKNVLEQFWWPTYGTNRKGAYSYCPYRETEDGPHRCCRAAAHPGDDDPGESLRLCLHHRFWKKRIACRLGMMEQPPFWMVAVPSRPLATAGKKREEEAFA